MAPERSNPYFSRSKRVEEQYVIGFVSLRRAVGWLGIALPTLLIALYLKLHADCQTPPSISHYYFTGLGTYFTGTLCAVALFLFAYNGPQAIDRWIATLAAICALGVAFFPTNPFTFCDGVCSLVDLQASPTRNVFHFIFAGLLFGAFAFFSLFLFPKTTPGGKMTGRKKMRNVVYYVCGGLICFSILSIVLLNFTKVFAFLGIDKFPLWTFVFETLGLYAFGFSWLTKGETILPDKKHRGEHHPTTSSTVASTASII